MKISARPVPTIFCTFSNSFYSQTFLQNILFSLTTEQLKFVSTICEAKKIIPLTHILQINLHFGFLLIFDALTLLSKFLVNKKETKLHFLNSESATGESGYKTLQLLGSKVL